MEMFDAIMLYLKGIMEGQERLISSILLPLQRSILRMVNSGATLRSIVSRISKTLENKLFMSPSNTANMATYLANVEKAARASMQAPQVGPALTGASRTAVLDMVKQSAINQLQNLNSSIKKDIGNTLRTGIAQGQPSQQIAATLQKQFNLHKSRAEMIARTETMRAANMTRHAQGITNGAKYFIVIPRAAACKYCYNKYEGEIFDINDTYAVPPLHPRCKCITAYFKTLDEAGKAASDVLNLNENLRQRLINDGNTINPSGTITRNTQYNIGQFDGPTLKFKNYNEALRYVKKNKPKIRYAAQVNSMPTIRRAPAFRINKDLIDRYGPMTIPRSKAYNKEKLLYKKVRMPIMSARHKLQRPQISQTIKDIKAGTAIPFNRNKVKIPSNQRKVYDFHVHTDASIDGKQTIEAAVKRAKKLGLDGIAITDHNTMKNASRWKEFSTDKFKVIPGMEITTSKGHMIALGITKPIRPMMSPRATLQAIKQQGGIAILPHSMAKYRDGIAFNLKRSSALNLKVDNMEIVNSRYGQGATNFKSRELSEAKRLSGVAGSDAHTSDGIGLALTEVRSRTGNSIDEVLTSIRLGKTNAYDSQIPMSKLKLTPIKWPRGTEIEPKKYPLAKEWM